MCYSGLRYIGCSAVRSETLNLTEETPWRQHLNFKPTECSECFCTQQTQG